MQSDKGLDFLNDVERQIEWYIHESGLDYEQSVEVAARFITAIDNTIVRLEKSPQLGKPRLKSFPSVSGMRSHPLEKPFERFRIFYRVGSNALYFEALIEGHQ